MKFCPLIVLLFAGNLLAQRPQLGPAGPGFRHGSVDDLKAALDLDDKQIAALKDVGAQRREALAPISTQLREKRRALNEALKSGQADAATLGQMLLEIERLRVQRKDTDSRYDEQALAVLTAEQQEELQKLRMALKLHPAALQAVWVGLLEGPRFPPRGEAGEDLLDPEAF